MLINYMTVRHPLIGPCCIGCACAAAIWFLCPARSLGIGAGRMDWTALRFSQPKLRLLNELFVENIRSLHR